MSDDEYEVRDSEGKRVGTIKRQSGYKPHEDFGLLDTILFAAVAVPLWWACVILLVLFGIIPENIEMPDFFWSCMGLSITLFSGLSTAIILLLLYKIAGKGVYFIVFGGWFLVFCMLYFFRDRLV
jgi:hypothetical protein